MVTLLREISWPQLRAQWGRTLLVVGGIATGVTLMVAINIINTSVLANFRRTIELMAGPAELEVVLGTGEVPFAESVLEVVRADPDVEAAIPLVRGTIAPADAPAEAMILFGVDFFAEEDLHRYQIVAATPRRVLLKAVENPRSVLLDTRYAGDRALAVGDTLRLSTPTGIDEFRVGGLLAANELAAMLGGDLVVMDLPAAQLVLDKRDRIDQIDLVLRAGSDLAAVRARLEATLPPALSVAQPARRGQHYERLLASFQAMLTGLSVLCLIAGLYMIYNTTSTGAAHRAFTMAGLRVVGANGDRLFHLLLLEALILGTVGAAGGAALGVGLAALLIDMVADSMAVIFKMRFPVESLTLDVPALVGLGAIGVCVALFASYFAARRVGSVEPLSVLRPNGSAPATPQVQRMLIWWLGLIAMSACMLTIASRTMSHVWATAGTSLWNASVVVVAVPLVTWSAALVSRVLSRLFSAEGEVAAHGLFRTPARTGLTAAAIALVLTTAVVWTAISESFRTAVDDYVRRRFAADLTVSAVTTDGGWAETVLPQAVVDELARVRGVAATETAQLLAGHHYRGERIGIVALSDGLLAPERFAGAQFRNDDPDAAARALRSGTGLHVATVLAERFDLVLGERLTLETPSGLLTLPIVGIADDYISERGSVILSRRLYRRYWLDSGVRRISLFLTPGASAADVRAAIADRLGDRYRLKVLTLEELHEYHQLYRRQAFAFTDAIQLLIVIVTIAGVFDLLLSTIIERRRELAHWRLIGADERTVRRSVMLEAATIGTLGAALGVVVSLVTSWIWVHFSIPILLGYQLTLTVPIATIARYTALVLAMTLLAGYLASSHATRSSILEGIRVE